MRWILFLLPIVIPVMILVSINEYARYYSRTPYLKADPEHCSWACHNNTNYCKNHHVNFLKPYFHQIDPFYFGMIQFLKSCGDYKGANIVILVFGWPVAMYGLLVGSMLLQFKIDRIKKGKP